MQGVNNKPHLTFTYLFHVADKILRFIFHHSCRIVAEKEDIPFGAVWGSVWKVIPARRCSCLRLYCITNSSGKTSVTISHLNLVLAKTDCVNIRTHIVTRVILSKWLFRDIREGVFSFQMGGHTPMSVNPTFLAHNNLFIYRTWVCVLWTPCKFQ